MHEFFRNATIARKKKQMNTTPLGGRIQHKAKKAMYQHLPEKGCKNWGRLGDCKMGKVIGGEMNQNWPIRLGT